MSGIGSRLPGGVRAAVGFLVVAVLGFFATLFLVRGDSVAGWVLYGLAVFRLAVMARDLRRQRRRDRELAATLRAEEEQFLQELREARAQSAAAAEGEGADPKA